MRLKDKVAIVTGAAHGMGEAEARLFAKEGAISNVGHFESFADVRWMHQAGRFVEDILN